MTEEEARDWISTQFGATGLAAMERLAADVRGESDRQNLISLQTRATIWSRHIVDSAQLLLLAPDDWTSWLDVGTGAGFPGLVVGLLTRREVTLVEPRRRRSDFLSHVIAQAGAARRISVAASRVERVANASFDVISARAVASIDALFDMTVHLACLSTTYLLLRGEQVDAELAAARGGWHGMFHVKQSLTNPASGVVVAKKVRAR